MSSNVKAFSFLIVLSVSRSVGTPRAVSPVNFSLHMDSLPYCFLCMLFVRFFYVLVLNILVRESTLQYSS
jgi:hypothetical protein